MKLRRRNKKFKPKRNITLKQNATSQKFKTIENKTVLINPSSSSTRRLFQKFNIAPYIQKKRPICEQSFVDKDLLKYLLSSTNSSSLSPSSYAHKDILPLSKELHSSITRSVESDHSSNKLEAIHEKSSIDLVLKKKLFQKWLSDLNRSKSAEAESMKSSLKDASFLSLETGFLPEETLDTRKNEERSKNKTVRKPREVFPSSSESDSLYSFIVNKKLKLTDVKGASLLNFNENLDSLSSVSGLAKDDRHQGGLNLKPSHFVVDAKYIQTNNQNNINRPSSSSSSTSSKSKTLTNKESKMPHLSKQKKWINTTRLIESRKIIDNDKIAKPKINECLSQISSETSPSETDVTSSFLDQLTILPNIDSSSDILKHYISKNINLRSYSLRDDSLIDSTEEMSSATSEDSNNK
ncbi:striatin homolog isoform X2 [Gordionus sp. m RMFG-2023]|uniref:striatin homolog isoform X2 n=1 Tax=Gordionus sp. m RMFG-2023 TaxID=3053472 RepID=UPI0031FCACB3